MQGIGKGEEKKEKKRKKVSDEKIEVIGVGCSLNRQSWQVDRLAEKCRAGNRMPSWQGRALQSPQRQVKKLQKKSSQITKDEQKEGA